MDTKACPTDGLLLIAFFPVLLAGDTACLGSQPRSRKHLDCVVLLRTDLCIENIEP